MCSFSMANLGFSLNLILLTSRADTKFLLKSYTNSVSIFYGLWDITTYLCDIASFQHPLFNALDWMRDPQKICVPCLLRKLDSQGYNPVLIAWWWAQLLWHNYYTCDRRTNRRTDRHRTKAYTVLCIVYTCLAVTNELRQSITSIACRGNHCFTRTITKYMNEWMNEWCFY